MSKFRPYSAGPNQRNGDIRVRRRAELVGRMGLMGTNLKVCTTATGIPSNNWDLLNNIRVLSHRQHCIRSHSSVAIPRHLYHVEREYFVKHHVVEACPGFFALSP